MDNAGSYSFRARVSESTCVNIRVRVSEEKSSLMHRVALCTKRILSAAEIKAGFCDVMTSS
jgi:hypothetical protein